MRIKDEGCKRNPEVCGEVAEHHNENSHVCQLPNGHDGDHVYQSLNIDNEMPMYFSNVHGPHSWPKPDKALATPQFFAPISVPHEWRISGSSQRSVLLGGEGR